MRCLREYLTIAEVKKLIATPFPNEKREIVKNAFLFSCYCGLRRSDIYSLTWGQITFDGSQWRVTTVMEKTEKPIYYLFASFKDCNEVASRAR